MFYQSRSGLRQELIQSSADRLEQNETKNKFHTHTGMSLQGWRRTRLIQTLATSRMQRAKMAEVEVDVPWHELTNNTISEDGRQCQVCGQGLVMQ